MLQLKMKNGEIIPVIQPTAAYPSHSANQRSYLEIHIAEDEMTFDEFYALVTNSAATEKLILINDDKDNPYTNVYEYYTEATEVSKKRITNFDISTGAPIEETHLVARLEQLTYTERKLKELGL